MPLSPRSEEDPVRLLRVLQEGTFERVGGARPLRSDYRLIAATNRDLAAEVREGRFREDLFYRLAAFPIVVPPPRDRREEIPTLALYFMEAVNLQLARGQTGAAQRPEAGPRGTGDLTAGPGPDVVYWIYPNAFRVRSSKVCREPGQTRH